MKNLGRIIYLIWHMLDFKLVNQFKGNRLKGAFQFASRKLTMGD